jgi:hypothetical protein
MNSELSNYISNNKNAILNKLLKHNLIDNTRIKKSDLLNEISVLLDSVSKNNGKHNQYYANKILNGYDITSRLVKFIKLNKSKFKSYGNTYYSESSIDTCDLNTSDFF